MEQFYNVLGQVLFIVFLFNISLIAYFEEYEALLDFRWVTMNIILLTISLFMIL